MEQLTSPTKQIIEAVCTVVSGKEEQVRKVLAAILAGGHILIDDIPGVGKTTMALAFSRVLGLRHKRMQFTADVLPSDVCGFSMYQKDTKTFKYMAGPVMTNLFLADELNRTSPKTQSALLEVMEEGRVTIDGHTLKVPEPFIVMATQNPIGSAGTQLLPESQLDRFMLCLQMGYPDFPAEIAMLKNRSEHNPLELLTPLVDTDKLLAMQSQVHEVFLHDALYDYILQLVTQTRRHPALKLGASPRATLALCSMSASIAYMYGRSYVLPQDVADIFKDVIAHRVLLTAHAKADQTRVETVLDQILAEVTQPVPKR